MLGKPRILLLIPNSFNTINMSIHVRVLSYHFSGPKEPGEEILNLMKTVKYDVEEMRLLEHTLIPPDGMYRLFYHLIFDQLGREYGFCFAVLGSCIS